MATTTETAGSTRRDKPAPSQRLLDTATALFSRYGIRAVGIDRVLAEAGVARASLYQGFGSKDGLIQAYLEHLDRRDRTRWNEAVATVHDPAEKVLTFFDLALASAPTKGFRGCQYANAATEFPDQILEPVAAHRRWLFETLVELLREAGSTDPDPLARRIQLLYDGALSGSKFEHSLEPLRTGRTLAAQLIAQSN